MSELKIPQQVIDDENSVELIRAFVAGGSQWVSLNPHLFRDRDFQEEKAWGIFLADTIKHLACTISEHTKSDEYSVMTDIFEAIDNELERSTSDVEGGYVEEST